MIRPLIEPADFVGLEGVTHLCTGGEAPWLREFDAVHAEFGRLKSGGLAGRAEIYRRGEVCRGAMGRLWGVVPEHIGFNALGGGGHELARSWRRMARR